MKEMTGIVINNKEELGTIESSYFSKQLGKRVYKVRMFDSKTSNKITTNNFKFIPEDLLKPVNIDKSGFSWKDTKIVQTLDKFYQASIVYKNQVISCKAINEGDAFDLLHDKIEALNRI